MKKTVTDEKRRELCVCGGGTRGSEVSGRKNVKLPESHTVSGESAHSLA